MIGEKAREEILNTAEKLEASKTALSAETRLPDRQEIYGIVDALYRITFSEYLPETGPLKDMLFTLYGRLAGQIGVAVSWKRDVDDLVLTFIGKIPEVREMLMEDVEAHLSGDPAAKSREEVILAYPGLYAIFVYRYAHILYRMNVPMIPRIMSEYAHGKTGIDINPGAKIGRYLFIDHGTGVVIGETAVIGDGVRIYQGVTIGALSTRKGQLLAGVKRHPTIEDNVIIYANATILGGDTVIGSNVTVAGNTFVTESIPSDSKVMTKMPELKVKGYGE